MAQLGIPYVLTGPDGSRAVFNSTSDPDFIGYLDPAQGITGLLDAADVRESYMDHTEGDGGVQGNNYHSRRVGTIQGILWPDPDMATQNLRVSKIMRASRGMKAGAPSILTWTPDGSSTRRLEVYRQAKPTITGQRPKTFLIPLSTTDPYTYSNALNQQVITPGGTSGDVGITSPISSPLKTTYQVSSQLFVSNSGDAETWPIFTIQGPITNPTLLNNTTGLQWTLTYTLQATDSIVVDTRKRTVLLNGPTDRYDAYAANFSTNTWWSLISGSNDVRLLSSAYSTGAQVTVQWRDAYEGGT